MCALVSLHSSTGVDLHGLQLYQSISLVKRALINFALGVFTFSNCIIYDPFQHFTCGLLLFVVYYYLFVCLFVCLFACLFVSANIRFITCHMDNGL